MSDKSGSDLKRELNQLWRTTVDQLDEIKDVIVKSSHAGKARLDAAFLERERDALLRGLGELVLLARAGDLPAAWREKINKIEALDAKLADQRAEFDALVQDVKDSIPDPAATKSSQGAQKDEVSDPRPDQD